MKQFRSPLTEERRKAFWIAAAAPLPEPKTSEGWAKHPIRSARPYRLPESLAPARKRMIAGEEFSPSRCCASRPDRDEAPSA